jgi:acetyl esterase/lipase
MKTHFLIALSTFFFIAQLMRCEAASSVNQSKIPVVQSQPTYQVSVKKDVVYAQGLRHDSINSTNPIKIPLLLDIYTPDNKITNRPVFLFIHGGAFINGKKDGGRQWGNYYASRGWVFVSIDYRLMSDNGTVPQKWIEYSKNVEKKKVKQFLAIYPAERDAKAALRYIIANANSYHINPNYVTVGGSSAGAITAITLGISNPEDYRDELTPQQDPTLPSTNPKQSYHVNTIIDLFGSDIALELLEKMYGYKRFNSSNPSLFIAHGVEDHTVDYSNAEKLKNIYQQNGVPYVFYPLAGFGHNAGKATVNGKNLEQLAFDFIVSQQKLVVKKNKNYHR